MKYRKKPVVIEAMQITDDDLSIAQIAGWMTGSGAKCPRVVGTRPFSLAIETLEGTMTAQTGDYVIKGVQGEFYPCKPDIFADTYEPVEDA